MDDSITQAFLDECDDSITELNNSLLDLEANPSNTTAIDEIFRRAHTLKGNFGAMGYESAARVAHAVEDLLDEVRNERLDVTAELMDTVFAGVDEIEQLVDEIRETGDTSRETDETVRLIRAVIDETSPVEATVTTDDADVTDASDAGVTDQSDADATDASAQQVSHPGATHRLGIRMRPGGLKSVDANLLLNQLPSGLEVLDAVPSVEAVRQGEFETGFDLFVDAGGVEDLEVAVDGLWGAESVAVTPVGPTSDPGETTSDTASAHPEPVSAADGPKAGAGTRDAEPQSGPLGEVRSIRVDVGQVDGLYELVEQLVTSRIKLRRAIDEGNIERTGDNLDELEKISAHLQATAMKMRLIPMEKVLGKFPRLVRDTARAQGKQIRLETEGQDIELDRTILEAIGDPLMHILRNAIDHGIEPPADRLKAGKEEVGHIQLRATRESDHVVVEISDDGRGLDVERIREKAVAKGLVSAAEATALADGDVYDFIFHPGFSTAEQVTDISGRGVGMDVVSTTIRQLDGSVRVDSVPGEGTTVTIRLPVSVAIVKVLLVSVGDAEYGIPIKSIDEIGRADGITTVNLKEVITHDNSIYPVIRLREVLGESAAGTGAGMIVRINPSERMVALHCDAVNQQEEVVVKPFQGSLHGVPGIAGAAVIGDGNIIPILDVATLGSGSQLSEVAA